MKGTTSVGCLSCVGHMLGVLGALDLLDQVGVLDVWNEAQLATILKTRNVIF